MSSLIPAVMKKLAEPVINYKLFTANERGLVTNQMVLKEQTRNVNAGHRHHAAQKNIAMIKHLKFSSNPK